jgi:hypothetical protein
LLRSLQLRLFGSLCGASPNLEDCWFWINKLKAPSIDYIQAMNYGFTCSFVMLWMTLNRELQNLSFKPKILEKLLEVVTELSVSWSDPQTSVLLLALTTAMKIVIKRDMGIATGEKELLAAMRVMLDNKGNKKLAIGFIVTLMLSVRVCVRFYLIVIVSSRCKFTVSQILKMF